MTELIPNLFIGNWHDAKQATDMHIITVAGDSPFIGHEHFPLIDGPGNDATIFHAAVDAVIAAHRQGKRILVHCIGGRSRSAAVIVAASAKLTSQPLCALYDELIRLRCADERGIRIHPHLASMLLEHE